MEPVERRAHRREIRELVTTLRYARQRRDRIAARAQAAAAAAAGGRRQGMDRLLRLLTHHNLVQGEVAWLERELARLWAEYRRAGR